jgi:hypothetical protein
MLFLNMTCRVSIPHRRTINTLLFKVFGIARSIHLKKQSQVSDWRGENVHADLISDVKK